MLQAVDPIGLCMEGMSSSDCAAARASAIMTYGITPEQWADIEMRQAARPAAGLARSAGIGIGFAGFCSLGGEGICGIAAGVAFMGTMATQVESERDVASALLPDSPEEFVALFSGAIALRGMAASSAGRSAAALEVGEAELASLRNMAGRYGVSWTGRVAGAVQRTVARLDSMVARGRLLASRGVIRGESARAVEAAQRTIGDHMSASDMLGAIEENTGAAAGRAVRRADGALHDHVGEVQDGLQGLSNFEGSLARAAQSAREIAAAPGMPAERAAQAASNAAEIETYLGEVRASMDSVRTTISQSAEPIEAATAAGSLMTEEASGGQHD
jgi:hypothetical protein